MMPSKLVYQHQQQIPINGTISGMAPPGNETGYYYIPIANLPWQTSWQELKDHVRTVCSVEHVQINDDGTGGHVVLKGRENFDAAFRLLNGGAFQDRALIADGRNADNWVLVKQQVDGQTALPQLPSTSRHKAPTPMMPPPSSTYGEWPATSAGSSYMMSPVMDSQSYYAPPIMPEYADPAAFYGAGSCAFEHSLASVATMNSVVPYPSGSGYVQQYAPSAYYGNNYSTPHDARAHQERKICYPDAVPTKRRKIIIRQLQPWVSQSQVRELICHKAGSAFGKLQKFDMPLADGQQGVNRGYAIVIFESEEAADKAIKRLNNYQYEGRVLEVKHTKEGVSDYQPAHGSRASHQRHSNHSRRERHDEKEKRGKERPNPQKSGSIGSQRKSTSPSSTSDVIIAHGSSISQV
ncbi:hypothetical protein F4802DRAFT_362491 [Xylaria palmicola]|nr:hypothetical protein F4802DRAFT_362491 [Xylaria palmicola]